MDKVYRQKDKAAYNARSIGLLANREAMATVPECDGSHAGECRTGRRQPGPQLIDHMLGHFRASASGARFGDVQDLPSEIGVGPRGGKELAPVR